MVLVDEDRPPSHSRLPRLRSDKAVHSAADLEALYRVRFRNQEAYRKQVCSVLAKYFSRWIPSDSVVLDVGCGYREFINEVRCSAKFAMDLNPEARKQASADVCDCQNKGQMNWSSTSVLWK
jgi:hypothetical protein